jgi:hypothetical protein
LLDAGDGGDGCSGLPGSAKYYVCGHEQGGE